MALSGTETDIINCVARLRMATKDQIRRDVGFSLEYMGYLCRYLVRKGYLNFSQGSYSLAKAGIKTILTESIRIDKELIKEVASEVAREISGELKRTIKDIKIPAPMAIGIKEETGIETPEERIKIKTDFDFPVEDESLTLESNINKIGTRMEKEKSDDMDKSVRLFKEIQKKRRSK
ncbi:MAG: hypothetical protein KJ666_09915 [Bacteroidetes bacterium]|nr:hypothetical protein [Bacteroidota bacterium]MBU2585721.1 hypothetical protein [Bacteroidota bacterium]